MATRPKFNITVNYPLPENQAAFEERVGKAVAKVLIETLPPKKIDELLLGLYKKEGRRNS